MDFSNKIAVITGGAQGIGKCICQAFAQAGATVCTIDLQENDYFQGDLSDKTVLEQFASRVIEDHGHIDYLINNAAPLNRGISEASYEDFEYALGVGVTAPFYLSKLFKEKTGHTLQYHILTIRLAEAKRYLLLGFTVKEVAALCGFKDVANFSKLFKREFGMNPTQWRIWDLEHG